MVVNAGVREFAKALRYALKYRPAVIVGWTQFVGRNKGFMTRFAKSLYLAYFFHRVLVYYDHEKRLIPIKKLARKTIGLNNTIADWEPKSASPADPKSFLFIGRYTEKSNLTLLLEAATKLEDMELHVIGANREEIPVNFHLKNVHIHGKVTDLERIEELSSRCTYFVYPGDVGLSIVHAVKLGLIPVVHSDLDSHMPECRAVSQHFPIIYFQNNSPESLMNTLAFLSELRPVTERKAKISSCGFEYFSQKIMINNFVTVIGHH